MNPIILHPEKPKDTSKLKTLFRKKKIKITDDFNAEIKELPGIKDAGVWIYFPWKEALIHTVSKKIFQKIRTARNQNLILPDEQKKFEKFKIGIAGLNVGNPAALCITLEGGGNMMKFADNDVLALSNFNRFRASLSDLGLNKAILSARQVYEINPFAEIKVYAQGIEAGNMEQFLLSPKIDVLVEEMDNLKLKIEIRKEARKHKIPVVMVTGNGANVIIDVERFDLNPRLPLLNGYLKKQIIEKIYNIQPEKATIKERVLIARDFMGKRHLTERLKKSFLQVGISLTGIPQIAESSFLRGAAVCYVVRQLATEHKMPSGRYHLRLDSLIK